MHDNYLVQTVERLLPLPLSFQDFRLSHERVQVAKLSA